MLSILTALLMSPAFANTFDHTDVCFSYQRADLTLSEATAALRELGVTGSVMQVCDVTASDLAFLADVAESNQPDATSVVSK